MLIKIADINIGGGTQPRENIDETTVAEYAEAMENGAKFPPVVVFDDGSIKWLAEGFHRYHATAHVGFVDIEADVRQGTRRDAVLHAVGSNTDHGLRRTNEDKRKAVLMLLNDKEWAAWSDHEIAKQCHVSRTVVDRVKSSLALKTSDKPKTTYTDKHGNTSTMNTANIGRKKGAKADQASVVCEPNMPITDGDEGEESRAEPAQISGTVSPASVYAGAAIVQLSKIRKWDKKGLSELKRVAAFIENKIKELSK